MMTRKFVSASMVFMVAGLGSFANAATSYVFTCSEKGKSDPYVQVTVEQAAYDDLAQAPIASIAIVKNGKVVESASNARIAEERLPVTEIEGQKLFAFRASLGRSGSLNMGWDVVNDSWTLGVNTMSWQLEMRAENADCSVVAEGLEISKGQN